MESAAFSAVSARMSDASDAKVSTVSSVAFSAAAASAAFFSRISLMLISSPLSAASSGSLLFRPTLTVGMNFFSFGLFGLLNSAVLTPAA